MSSSPAAIGPASRAARAIASNFGLITASAVAAAFVWPTGAAAFAPAIFACLAVMFALNYAVLDLEVLRGELSRPRRLAWAMCVVLILRPAIAFGAAWLARELLGAPQGVATAMLILFAVPPAGVTPTLSLLFGGRLERTLFVMVSSTLLTPLYLPLLLDALGSGRVHVDVPALALRLGLLIFGPLVLVLLARKTIPRVRERLLPIAPGISTPVLALLLFGAMGSAVAAFDNPSFVTKAILSALAVMATVATSAWLLAGVGNKLAGADAALGPDDPDAAPGSDRSEVGRDGGGSEAELGRDRPRASLGLDRPDRISAAIVTTWPNIGLAVLLATEVYGDDAPRTATIVALATLPWALTLGPARWLARRPGRGEKNARISGAFPSNTQ